MDIVDELRAFVATAQTGSFTGAADQLGVSNRLTSKYVAELERRLSVRLFQRTTRKVGLTPAGEDLLARAPAVLEDLDDLLATVTEEGRALTGTLRVSAPVTFGEVWVTGMLGRFGAAHRGISLDLRLKDDFVDLAAEGIDLAFRIGHSEMLSLKTRKLGEMRSVLVASPDYLMTNGAPLSPKALADHSCILDMNRHAPRRWSFDKAGETLTVDVNGRFRVNSARAATDLAAAGQGVALIPHFSLRDRLDRGELIELLTDWTGPASPLSAVYLEGRVLPRKTRALIDFAQADLGKADIL
ncbi:DNA-binding transcriptional LysR family regulator [Sagittula marina]|uniref:DNA-binding transcriptional LysR family regulator n=1 Tax=Sagittula marina TaxID=943940 RepID=A0A7W6DMJ4_9RHOB|nr:LysR family transcriptional regulator [Sagittula marina]MBB3985344.1 DNA-binding transcriptional LysR family regulator [Sagittula marina]